MLANTLVALMLGSTSVLSEDEQPSDISIIGTRIVGLFEDRGDHYYNRIFTQLVDGYDGAFTITLSPIRRASLIFSTGGADCLFIGTSRVAAYTNHGLPLGDFIFTKPINVTKIKAYTAAGTAPIESFEELSRGVITVDGGIGDDEQIHTHLPAGTKTIVSPSLKHGFKMLDLGRTSILLAFALDVKQLLKQDQSYAKYSVSKVFVVDSSEGVVVCRRFPRTLKFIEYLNDQIENLKKNNILP
ncbi:MAG: hypothetical protein AB3N28_10845 [Kordiimonas sp.]